jgi:hypothetical protein
LPAKGFAKENVFRTAETAISAINEVQIGLYLIKPWDPPEERFYPNGAKIRNFWDVCGGRVCGLPVPIRGGLAD